MSYFLPYIQQTTYFSKTNLDSITSSLIRECCADSHTDFLTKSTHPLWLNLDVFITLPFKKKNEDNSPTEASHIGMNLEHPQLATKELAHLQTKCFIEPTISQWACQAFYINKRSRQVHEKMRLVIDYESVNYFLDNDNFLLQSKRALFLIYPKQWYSQSLI